MRRELDWIVMKALDKDRNRRFQTCASFADDIVRYLNDDPVQSCPPSRSYLFAKFVRRNAAAVASITAIMLSLVVGMASTTWFMLKARESEARVLRECALTVSQGQQTLLNVAQNKAMMDQRESIDAQAATAYRQVASQIFNEASVHKEFEPVAKELLLTLLEMWNQALAGNDRIREANRATFEKAGMPAFDLVSNKRREEYLRTQRADVLARLGRHKEAFDQVFSVVEMAGDSSEFLTDSVRTCAICAVMAKQDGQMDLARRYTEFGRNLINNAADQTQKEVETWNKLVLLDAANDTTRPSLEWLENLTQDPEINELGLHTQLKELLTEFRIRQPNRQNMIDDKPYSK